MSDANDLYVRDGYFIFSFIKGHRNSFFPKLLTGRISSAAPETRSDVCPRSWAYMVTLNKKTFQIFHSRNKAKKKIRNPVRIVDTNLRSVYTVETMLLLPIIRLLILIGNVSDKHNEHVTHGYRITETFAK